MQGNNSIGKKQAGRRNPYEYPEIYAEVSRGHQRLRETSILIRQAGDRAGTSAGIPSAARGRFDSQAD
mgnify:CR=1 FL=1